MFDYVWFRRVVHVEVRAPAPHRGGALQRTRSRLGRVFRDELLRSIGRGAVAGILAGVMLTAALLLVAAARRQDLWTVLEFAALPLAGERVLAPGFEGSAVTMGVAMHGLVVPRLLFTSPRIDPISVALHVLFGLALAGSLLVFEALRRG
jgi:hypothetical protein